ncbi:alpha/beta hydrolase [Geobacter argillaceus]|uniref:alpha/beta hydrolase n=1 Tax=Geobacter argillaceus TaxID=345631 RepID=UPI001FEACA51|nr:alpha/beta hydrolase [Geobacter argillaceus]
MQSIDYTCTTNPDERVEILLDSVTPTDKPLILVGSSMGGYVSVVASRVIRPRGLFLLAPALYLPGHGVQEPVPFAETIEIVHGWGDDIVPPENSIRFARLYRTTLHMIDGDHPLNGQVDVIGEWFERYLKAQ